MNVTLRHPASLVTRVALLGPVVGAGLQDSAADLLSVAALDLLAEQARTSGRPELALRRATESASLHAVIAGVVGPDVVETCLAAIRQRDLDLLAAHLCTEVHESAQAPAVPRVTSSVTTSVTTAA